ncbi:hypothetical protein FO519_008283 [Halicephalobus sp. NKZ332]|nr:hypothetical protein FO519_008283 [Halicephalobus sp. NKZ332]
MPGKEVKENVLTNQNCDVLVVGAGISGLVSAREILKADPGLKVLIIEGKNRVGGRTHTVELKCAGGETEKWDIGGQWVGKTQTHIIDLIKELDLETYDQYSEGTKWIQIGNSKHREYDSRFPIIDKTGNTDTGADAIRITGGTQQISQKLCGIIGWDKIHLNQALLKLNFLDENDDDTLVEAIIQSTLDETKISKITAKRVILAIPPAECSKIRFQSPLPFDKKQFFDGCYQGNFIKFVATYETPFWREDGFSGEIFSMGFTNNPRETHPLYSVLDATTATGKSALVGFCNNETWSDSTPKARKEAVLKDLARFLGDKALKPIDYVDKDWGQEIFTGGCPTGIIPAGNMAGLARAREPWKTIHFAGTEMATVWIGYMSGGVQSGLRASHEVLLKLGNKNVNWDYLNTDWNFAGKMVDYFEIFNDTKIAIFHQRIDNKTLCEKIARVRSEKNDDDPFVVLNLTILIDKYFQWKRELPRVKPFYAVKCNDDPLILRTLGALGCGFDCASKNEINKILKLNIVGPEKIIYANPCKTRGFVAHADQVGIRRMTFDNVEELLKVKQFHSNPEMILRIAVDDPTATIQMGMKFGCDPVSVAPNLLQKALELQIKVVGISFHVGTGCKEPFTFETAIKHSRDLFDFGIQLGHHMKVLDIGGGFPGFDTDHISLTKIANVVNCALEKYFPVEGNYEIIAEPGRFFAAAPMSVVTNIISSVKVPASRITRKKSDANKDGFMYYVNEGTYGYFNCKFYEHYCPPGEPLFPNPLKDGKLFHCTVWGPTCDGLDQMEESSMKRNLEVGEWLYYPNMGAYTLSTATTFNGFKNPKIYYFIDEKSL